MRCFICGSKTEVTKTLDREQGTRVLRKRRCVADSRHVMDTMESFLPPSLDEVGVRQSGSGRLAAEPFSRSRLERDIANSIFRGPGKDKDPEDVAARVTARVVRSLQARLIDLALPVSVDERTENPTIKAAISDVALADTVEAELQHMSLPLPRVLYALSIRGRQDRKGRVGWTTARDALSWIYTNYPKLAQPLPPAPATPETFSWLPPYHATQPQWVLKRSRSRPARFDASQFGGSIRRAMLGRAGADLRANWIAEWVLHGLQGQQLVASAQLGAGVLDALRRTDDIAYLRWACVFKGLEEVAEIADEARALIVNPSPRLLFGEPRPVAISRGTPLQ
ncbi:hypothetical protein MT356_19870 [Rathayibacter festucae]|uniref:hypothetical protein n=1 Tax=Rathayibacter festucae TaxID=110937 RepID=UPI001FB32C54|nr:hypothetical protein [Rathayibacter festucae]MCJ1701975.1 hypothetical protein [Rathayibacter festucae]